MRLETLESRARDLREELERIESDIERLAAQADEDGGS
jgi:chaperonin cofactor prefoldin